MSVKVVREGGKALMREAVIRRPEQTTLKVRRVGGRFSVQIAATCGVFSGRISPVAQEWGVGSARRCGDARGACGAAAEQHRVREVDLRFRFRSTCGLGVAEGSFGMASGVECAAGGVDDGVHVY